jgi:hypothetical protein
MRRLLAIAIALVAAPHTAGAQTAGTIFFNAASTSPTINAAQCNGAQTDTIALTWTIQLESGALFATGGEYRIYASTGDPGNVSPFCYTPDSVGQTAGLVPTSPSTPDATIITSSASVTASSLVAAVKAAPGYDCTADKTIVVCALWFAASGDLPGSHKGYAKGQVLLKAAAPVKPVVTKVRAGDRALYATMAPGTRATGDAEATEFKAKAVADLKVCPTCGTTAYLSPMTPLGGEARIDGLTNNVQYIVTAFAYSAEGNESKESDAYTPLDPGEVTPRPVRNFWGQYNFDGGRDTGGCDAGPAGLLALLGAAATLRLRRRT